MFLFTADLHLTSLPDDEYRWSVIPWLKRQCENRGVKALFILGDMTDRKDEHPAALVDRLCRGLNELSTVCPVHVLMGNHDYVEPSQPFFGFLESFDRVRFYYTPTAVKIAGQRFLFLPHCSNRDWGRLYGKYDLTDYDRVMIHQPIKGAVGSNRHKVGGVPRYWFKHAKAEVLAGDIHVPQKKGNVLYCGAPYPINFGDEFQPRVLFDPGNGELKSIPRHTIRKMIFTLTAPEQLADAGLTEGDRAKVTLCLPEAEVCDWPNQRRALRELAQDLGIHLAKVSLKVKTRKRIVEEGTANDNNPSNHPRDVFDRYCELAGVEDGLIKVGRELLEVV